MATTPSIPSARVASNRVRPSPGKEGVTHQPGPSSPRSTSRARRVSQRRAMISSSASTSTSDERQPPGSRLAEPPPAHPVKVVPTVLVEHDEFPVEDRAWGQRPAQRVKLRQPPGHVCPPAGQNPQAFPIGVDDGPKTTTARTTRAPRPRAAALLWPVWGQRPSERTDVGSAAVVRGGIFADAFGADRRYVVDEQDRAD